jgi:hypothetical protein
MYDLYPITKGQAAIRDLFRVGHDRVGNPPPLPSVLPDYPTPIVRVAEGGRDLALAPWSAR